jgi:hypothetical protein
MVCMQGRACLWVLGVVASMCDEIICTTLNCINKHLRFKDTPHTHPSSLSPCTFFPRKRAAQAFCGHSSSDVEVKRGVGGDGSGGVGRSRPFPFVHLYSVSPKSSSVGRKASPVSTKSESVQ